MWDAKRRGNPQAVNRDQVSGKFAELGFDPLLEGTVTVTLADGERGRMPHRLQRHRDLIDASYSPEQVEKLTWAPADAMRTLARLIAPTRRRRSSRWAWGRTSSSTTTSRTARCSSSRR
jgi:nitrate reductase / nitrite oxidoreductase, alpha subunit